MRWGPNSRRVHTLVTTRADSLVVDGECDSATYGSSGINDESGVVAAEKGTTDVHTVHDVREWLRRAGFDQYEEVFMMNEVDGDVLKTLTSEELRDDLGVTNLRHRRDILDAVRHLVSATASVKVDALPEHGRILDHLSNVRTYHSWIRLGVQLLAFAVVTLHLAPNFRGTGFVIAASSYFASIGIIALLYGIFRYKAVISMIEQSGASTPKYNPDRLGVFAMLLLVLIASMVSLTLIVIHGY